jgi:hypothetical protein
MSEILWTGFMSRTSAELGWATNTVRFPEQPVVATVALASYLGQNGERFEPFQPRYVQCWIETEKTPLLSLAGIVIPNPDRFADVQVWLSTTWIRFELQTDGVGGGAVETIFSTGTGVNQKLDAVDQVHRVVHDEQGRVIGVHREVQLEGGPDLDETAIEDAVLARAAASRLTGLQVAPVDLDAFSSGARLRVDVESGRVRAE